MISDVMRRLPLLAIAAGLTALTACGGSGTSGGTTTAPGTQSTGAGATTSVAPVRTMDVAVYLMRGDKLGVAARTVPATTAVAAAAMRELLAGPTAREAAAGLATAIPSGTRLRGLAVANGVATVDLSARYASGGGSLSMSARLGQVVYTLTRFPSIRSVRFRLDGAPVTTFSSEGIVLDGPQTRADSEDVTPAILVERPAVGAISPLPLRVAGTADVFEAVVSYEVLDAAGRVLARGTTMASCGTGCRGRFQQTIPLRPPSSRGTLLMYEVSARDGSRVNQVRIPLRFSGG